MLPYCEILPLLAFAGWDVEHGRRFAMVKGSNNAIVAAAFELDNINLCNNGDVAFSCYFCLKSHLIYYEVLKVFRSSKLILRYKVVEINQVHRYQFLLLAQPSYLLCFFFEVSLQVQLQL